MARFILSLCLLIGLPASHGSTPTQEMQPGADMITQFNSALPRIYDNAFGIPLSLDSMQQGDLLQGEVLGILPHDFSSAREVFTRPEHWCDTLLMHLNTKACVYENDRRQIIHLYSGRKFYQPIGKATRISLDFDTSSHGEDFARMRLHAKQGPMGTSDYSIELSAMPLPASARETAHQQYSLVRLRFSYRTSWLARRMMNLYLNHMADSKEGFTIVDRQHQQPVYIKGLAGVIERNTMRYYLAIVTRLDGVKQAHSMQQQFNRWFDATERYHRQLHEVDKSAYLQAKARELANQRQQQQHLQAPEKPRLASFN